MAFPEGPSRLLAAEMFDVGIPGRLEVLGDERSADPVFEFEQTAGSPALDSLPGLTVHVVLQRKFCRFGEFRRIYGRHRLGPANADRLELLISHQRAGAGPRRRAGPFDNDGRIGDHILAGRPDDGRPGIGILHLLENHLFGGFRVLAPHLGGIPDFNLVVLDRKPDRFFRFSLDVNAVPAGPFDLVAEMAAHLGMADQTRMDALIHEACPRGWAEGAVQRTGTDEKEAVLGPGIVMRLVLRRQIIRAQTGAADEFPRRLIGELTRLDLALAQIHFQNFSEISAFGCCHRDHLPFPDLPATTLSPLLG